MDGDNLRRSGAVQLGSRFLRATPTAHALQMLQPPPAARRGAARRRSSGLGRALKGAMGLGRLESLCRSEECIRTSLSVPSAPAASSSVASDRLRRSGDRGRTSQGRSRLSPKGQGEGTCHRELCSEVWDLGRAYEHFKRLQTSSRRTKVEGEGNRCELARGKRLGSHLFLLHTTSLYAFSRYNSSSS